MAHCVIHTFGLGTWIVAVGRDSVVCTAATYGCTATIYGCTATIYGCTATIYGCTAAIYGCTAAIHGWTVEGLFPSENRLRRVVDHQPAASAEVKERV